MYIYVCCMCVVYGYVHVCVFVCHAAYLLFNFLPSHFHMYVLHIIVFRGVAITMVLVSFVLLFSIMLYMHLRKPVNKTWQGMYTNFSYHTYVHVHTHRHRYAHTLTHTCVHTYTHLACVLCLLRLHSLL